MGGDSVTWINNRGFPHNVVFDEDDVPGGVNVDKISAEDLLNAAGEKHTAKFDVTGEYGYYCEPHQGAGMVGRVIVKLGAGPRRLQPVSGGGGPTPPPGPDKSLSQTPRAPLRAPSSSVQPLLHGRAHTAAAPSSVLFPLQHTP